VPADPKLAEEAVVIEAWHGGIAEFLSWSSVARYQGDLLSAVAAHPILAPAAYTLVYAVIVAFSIPEAAIVTALGGLLFGALLGGTLAVLGATAGAVALFVVARTAFAATLARRAEALLDRIRPGLHRDGFSYLLALRLIPAVPFWLVNLGAAFCGMRLLPYAAATLIGIIPVTFLFAWIGSGVSDVLAAGQAPDLSLVFSPRVLGPLLGLAVVALLPVVWRRWKRGDA
jgi:uncharacterized membrane protein YdjX (TVP38/TMEM64 family)